MKSKNSRSRWWQSVEGDRYFAAFIFALVLISVLIPTVSGIVLTATAEYTLAVTAFALAAAMVAFSVAIGFVRDVVGQIVHDDLLWDHPTLSRKKMDAEWERIRRELDPDDYWYHQVP